MRCYCNSLITKTHNWVRIHPFIAAVSYEAVAILKRKGKEKDNMSEITLNIYGKGNKKEPVKVLTAEGYDLMLGTIEDFMEIIDLDKIDDNKELAKMVVKGYEQLKPLLKDIFEDMTDEDFRGVKVPDLVLTILDVGKAIGESLNILKTGKNQ